MARHIKTERPYLKIEWDDDPQNKNDDLISQTLNELISIAFKRLEGLNPDASGVLHPGRGLANGRY